jgi:hypothetical protein
LSNRLRLITVVPEFFPHPAQLLAALRVKPRHALPIHASTAVDLADQVQSVEHFPQPTDAHRQLTLLQQP